MSIFRKLLIFGAALVILLFLAGIIMPKSIEIERSASIDAPVDSVYKQVSILRNMAQWTPWKDYDPDMLVTFEGEDGQVGSVYKWNGNSNVGSGNMEITSVDKNKIVEIKLSYIEPYESSSKIYFLFNGDSLKTNVTWGYFEKVMIPKNVITSIFGVKKMLSKEFDKGLINLTRKCEN